MIKYSLIMKYVAPFTLRWHRQLVGCVEEMLLLGGLQQDATVPYDHEPGITEVGCRQSLVLAIHHHYASCATA